MSAPSALQQFEALLVGAADASLSSAAPSGGFAAFLQREPAVAALFVVAVTSAHTYLSGLEAKLDGTAQTPTSGATAQSVAQAKPTATL